MTIHKYTIRLGYTLILAFIGFTLFYTIQGKEEKIPLTQAETAQYIAQLEVSDLLAERIEMVGGHKQPGIWFRLRNNSDATFSSVKVKISFFDRQQQLVYETFFHPIHNNSTFSYAFKKLPPNQTWQMSSSRYYTPSNVPNHWESGNATVEVVDITLLSRN